MNGNEILNEIFGIKDAILPVFLYAHFFNKSLKATFLRKKMKNGSGMLLINAWIIHIM